MLLFCVSSAFSGEIVKPQLAVVIDDFGLTYPTNVPDEAWMKAPFPMTFAVMPKSPRTKRAAEETKKAGKELIIHFPFDPFLSLKLPQGPEADPQDEAKIRELLADARKTIPGAVGLNNHRSYKATKNAPLMRWFMGQLKGTGLYFVDSKVSPKTVAYREAKSAGLKAASNRIFLEEPGHYNDKAFCEKMLRVAASAARREGKALTIGHHYFHGTYDCLMESAPVLKREGFEFVFASEVVR